MTRENTKLSCETVYSCNVHSVCLCVLKFCHTCIWLGISQISRVATPPTMFKYKGNNLATSKIVAKEHKITQFHTSI